MTPPPTLPSAAPPPPLPPSADPFIGRTLGGKYHLTRLLGRGGFGAVYHALQAPIDRPVAVKLIRHLHPDTADLRRRFALEARALAHVSSHPDCAAFIDLGEEPDGLLYLVQDFIDGRPLDAVLRDEGPLAPARAVMIAGAVLDALHTAHHHGIVHRDIKPSNVMLLTDHAGRERVKLLDFGIAHVVGPARGGISPTATGVIVGSPEYMAPEQFSGAGISPRVDLYAVGVLLYELLTGAPPFEGTAFELMHHHFSCPPRPIGPEAPAALERALDRALRKEPGARFRDAAAMRDALYAALAPPYVAAPGRPSVRFAVVAALLATGAFAALPFLRAPPAAGGVPSGATDAGPDTAPGVGVVDGATDTSGTLDHSHDAAPVVGDATDMDTVSIPAPDANVTPGEATPDPRPIDASAADPRARRRGPPRPAAVIEPTRRRFADALDRCDCAAAAELYSALATAPAAAALRARFDDQCRRLDRACLRQK